MIRDITIGQYFPGDSVIHRLDSRVKIIATLLFIIEIFIVDNFLGFALAAACLGAVITVSKVPLGYIVRGLKPIIIILLFTFALNMPSGTVKSRLSRARAELKRLLGDEYYEI